MSGILYCETSLNVVVLQVHQMKDKIAAKEQNIADLQKKAQVIPCLDFFMDFVVIIYPVVN
jgi:hypothetical protein